MQIFYRLNQFLAWWVTHATSAATVFQVFSRILPVPMASVRGVPIKIVIQLNQVGVFRTFQRWNEREPETLDWIDAIPPDAVLLDVGASFGTETLYAALKLNGPRKIIACDLDFQASFDLAYNLLLNHIEHVDQYYVGLSARADFITTAHHTNYACVHGRPRYDQIVFKTFALSLDEFVDRIATHPDYIKIDVDGHEALLLEGMRHTLRRPNLKSVLIEVNAETQASVTTTLQVAGFTLTRQVADGQTSNLIFVRSGNDE